LIGEASQYWRHDLIKISRNFLVAVKRRSPESSESTYRSQSNGCRSQPYQTAIAGVRLVNGVRVIVTELVDDYSHLLMVTVI
jgi:hypothetical protein